MRIGEYDGGTQEIFFSRRIITRTKKDEKRKI